MRWDHVWKHFFLYPFNNPKEKEFSAPGLRAISISGYVKAIHFLKAKMIGLRAFTNDMFYFLVMGREPPEIYIPVSGTIPFPLKIFIKIVCRM
ncbi:MAG: hypothetical protein IIZ39_03825 [Blautia sp.]|nr:hypothetical protein [Blautia sp.]